MNLQQTSPEQRLPAASAFALERKSMQRRRPGLSRIWLMLFASILAVPVSLGLPLLTTAGAVNLDAPDSERTVAVTIDDLPTVGAGPGADLSLHQQVTRNLVGRLVELGIPAVGFVNEGKMAVQDEEDERRMLLKRWVDAGLELANHTYSHHSFSTTPLDSFKADVIRGEVVTSELMAEAGLKLRYFRHPFLQTGPDETTKAAFEEFLRTRGYTVAPVTVSNFDWVFNTAYMAAGADSALRHQVIQSYLDFTDRSFEWAEQFSHDLLGYELPQILLLHANPLNADHLDAVMDVINQRGYGVVTLETALKDDAYSMGDPVAAPEPMDWLHRWERAHGVSVARPFPEIEPFVLELAESARTNG
jgi:peptidoglycan/xylan/chitin deacetylase (PgdA/CDA1 family)